MYNVIKEIDHHYMIIDDNGNEYLYDRIQFKTLSEIRNEKINKLLE
jgi:hypothetical protein